MTRPSPQLKKRQSRLIAILLSIWAMVSFVVPLFARDLSFEVWGWPFHFWMASQGAVLVFLFVVAVYAGLMNRWESQDRTRKRHQPDDDADTPG